VRSEARHTRDGAGEGPRASGPRPLHAWSVLDRDQRLAVLAAVALFVSMLLPWYQQNAVVAGTGAKRGALVSQNLNAFAVFSFVEAAVLLVALAVLFLLYRRAEGATFHLPGSDGAVIFAAGLWTGLLLVLRLFDKPGITHNGVAANVGVQWGIFFALAAAGLLAYSGSRMRAGRRHEAPLVRRRGSAERTDAEPPHAPRAPDEEPTRREPAPPDEQLTHRHSPAPPDAAQTFAASRGERPRYPPTPAHRPERGPAPVAEQLSFEDDKGS
jgi:hypothetical protein